MKLERLSLAGFEEVSCHVVRESMERALRTWGQPLGAAGKGELWSYYYKEMNSATIWGSWEDCAPVENLMRLEPQLALGLQLSETLSRGTSALCVDFCPDDMLVFGVNYFLDYWAYFKSLNKSPLLKVLLKCSEIYFLLKLKKIYIHVSE